MDKLLGEKKGAAYRNSGLLEAKASPDCYGISSSTCAITKQVHMCTEIRCPM